MDGDDLAERHPGLRLLAIGALSWMIWVSLHSKATGLSATRGTLTSLPGTAVRPAILNSLTSRATWAAVAFICFARSLVARFQTNSLVSWMLPALSFQLVEEKPMIGGL